MIEFKAKTYIPDNADIGMTYNKRTVHFKEHVHDFAEFIYIVSGKCFHYVNKIPFEAGKGDLIYIAPGETHAFQSDDEVISYEFYVRPDFLFEKLLSGQPSDAFALSLFSEFSTEISSMAPHVSLRGSDMVETENLFSYSYKEYKSKNAGKESVIKGYFLVIVTKFLREIRKKQLLHVESQLSTIMPEIIEYIEENYYKSLSLEELAEKSFYNSSYFSRIFKEVYGKTLTEFITEKRISESVKLLENTELTIEEICHRIGYIDQKYFYKLFKNKMGLTPGQYRRETISNSK